jgi:hypothetical protein
MRKLLTFLITLTIALSPIGSAFADGSGIFNPSSNNVGDFQGIDSNAAASGSGGCSQATTFLARTSGLSGTETTAYTAMICGLVSDGIITGSLSGVAGCGTKLDALYIFATNTTTTANLNLCGTGFGITTTVAPTFSADHGYTGNGTTQFLNTNFNPATAAGNYALNSASIGVYTLTNRAPDSVSLQMGAVDGGFASYNFISVLSSASAIAPEMNGGTFGGATNNGVSQGFTAVSRTVATGINAYKNASSASLGTIADSSVSIPNAAIYICAYNEAGTAKKWSIDQVSAAFIGGGLTGVQFLQLSNRINAYMAAMPTPINVY